MKRVPAPIEQRLLDNRKIDSNGCWIWVGAIYPTGYGMITVGEKTMRVHRVSYEKFKGSAKGRYVCHKCDVRRCFNPSHLWLGDGKSNAQDTVKKNRHQFKKRKSCGKGHKYGAGNTRFTKLGRVCLVCARARNKAYKLRLRGII